MGRTQVHTSQILQEQKHPTDKQYQINPSKTLLDRNLLIVDHGPYSQPRRIADEDVERFGVDFPSDVERAGERGEDGVDSELGGEEAAVPPVVGVVFDVIGRLKWNSVSFFRWFVTSLSIASKSHLSRP